MTAAPGPRALARPGLPRILVVLLATASAFVVIAGLRQASHLVGPVFLALVCTITVHPLRIYLERWLPSWLSGVVCLLVVYLAFVALALALLVSTARFAALLPDYQDQIRDGVDSATGRLKRLGVDREQIEKIASGWDAGRLADVVSETLSGVTGLVTSLVFILTLAWFMAVDASWFARRLTQIAPAGRDLTDALARFARGTRRYLLVSTVFGLIVAVLDTIALALLDVPLPLMWGLLAFLTNYIPNIGFVIGLVPPAVLALLEGGPGLMLAVIVIYCVLNVVIQSAIQPKVVGDAVGLSATLSFISLVFWSWVLGAYGAFLAIPFSLLVRAVLLDADAQGRWLLPLVSNQDAEKDGAG